MPLWERLEWDHIDIMAIVGDGGLGTIDEKRHDACLVWLSRHGYNLDTIDCTQPVNEIVADLQRLFHWEARFGYAPDPANRNLHNMEDAFTFDIPEGGGHVLELLGADMAWQKEPEWILGLLLIAQMYSRCQLALGRRFFALLVIPEDSDMIGEIVQQVRVPSTFYGSHPSYHLFER